MLIEYFPHRGYQLQTAYGVDVIGQGVTGKNQNDVDIMSTQLYDN